MEQHVGFMILGLGSGAVYAALAVALVVTYRSSGTINIATGAMAMLSAYMYAFLRQGELFIIIPGFPTTVHLADSMGFVPALAISLALSGLLGVVLYAAVFRWLRPAPPVARVVASVGVMVVLQALMALRLGTNPVGVGAIFPSTTYTWSSIPVPADRLYFVATICAVVLVLGAIIRFTRFGLATRAVAESEKGAIVTSIEPNRIALANWGLSGVVAGLAGILIAPIVPLQPASYSLFIVPALAAAVFGRLSRLLPALIGGLLIGVLQSEVSYFGSQHTWMPPVGVPEALPLIGIIVVLALGGGSLPERGALIEKNLGAAPRPKAVVRPAIIGIVVGLAALLLTSGGYRAGVISTFLLAVLCLSLVVITGFVGQISLAQLTLAGAGAFLAANVLESWGVPFPFAPIGAALGATLLGVVVGLPALRIRGLSFVAITLAMGVAIESLWFRNDNLNGGIAGASIGSPRLFGLDLGIGEGRGYPKVQFGILCLVVLVAVAGGVTRLRRSPLGARMLAVRSNERAAAVSGIDVARTKIAAFAIASFIAGLAGAMLAYEQTIVSVESFAVLGSLGLFATAYMAGITTVSGGILAGIIAPGGILSVFLERQFQFGGWYQIISGIGLIFTVVRHPDGIVGEVQRVLGKRRSRSRGAVATPPPATAGTWSARRAGEAPLPDGPLLEIRDLTVRYGGVVAVDQVSFDVPRGSITGLIGPNGAGKTTLIDAICRLAPATSGMIAFAGRDLRPLATHERTRAGIGRTFQSGELWDELTVAENVVVGERPVPFAKRWRHGQGESVSRDVEELLEFLGISELRDVRAGELSQGRRRLVGIARSLVARPALLLLDEPAAGLDSTESKWLAVRLGQIREAGVTLFLVDHDMALVLGICDQIQVLNFGKLISSGPPDLVRADPEVVAAYLGSTAADVSEVVQ